MKPQFSRLLGCFLSLSLLQVAAPLLAPAQAVVVDRLDAIVNKKPIFKSDVDKFKTLLPLRRKVDPLFNNDPIAKKDNLSEAECVQFLVDEALITEKFPVSDSDVEQEINGIQSNLHIDRDQLKAAIAREGFKFEDYFQLMRVSIAKRMLIDREIRNKAAVSDDDLRAEYNREQSGSKSFRGSFHIFMITIPKNHYKSVALAKEIAQKAEKDLEDGKKFEDVAKEYSDDANATNGGDLGYLSYSEMAPSLQNEVRRLGPGKTSGIIETKDSFQMVRVGDVKADTDEGFEREKETLRAKLLESEFGHQIRLWLDRQRTLNNVKILI